MCRWLPADPLLVLALCAAAAFFFALPASRTGIPRSLLKRVVELHIDDEIEPMMAEYIVNGIIAPTSSTPA